MSLNYSQLTKMSVEASNFLLCPRALFQTVQRYVEPSFSLDGTIERTDLVGDEENYKMLVYFSVNDSW